MKKVFSLVLVVAMIFGIIACSPAKPAADTSAASGVAEAVTNESGYKVGDKVLFGVSVRGLDNYYYVELMQGINAVAAQIPNCEVVLMEHDGDDQKEVNDVKSFAARDGYKCLYIDPQSSAICAEVAEICEDAKVYWTSAYTLGEGIYPWTYHYFVSHQALDDVTAGYEVAKAMFEEFDGKEATVGIVAGELSNLASINRIKGFDKAIAEFPNVTLVDTQPGNWDTTTALEITQTWLSKYPDLNGIFAANDGMAVGCVEALKAAGKNGQIKVVGVDCIPTGVEAVIAGDMSATFYPYAKLMGGYGIAMAYQALKGNIDPDKLSQDHRACCYLTPGLVVKTADAQEINDNLVMADAKIEDIDWENPTVWGIAELVVEE